MKEPDSLENIVSNLGSTLFCKGQDWQEGDDIVVEELVQDAITQMQAHIKQAKERLLEQVEAIVDEQDPSTGRDTGKSYWGNTLRQRLQQLKEKL